MMNMIITTFFLKLNFRVNQVAKEELRLKLKPESKFLLQPLWHGLNEFLQLRLQNHFI